MKKDSKSSTQKYLIKSIKDLKSLLLGRNLCVNNYES
jgi:hypothetical protein